MKRFLISLFLSCLLSNVALAQEAETIFISATVSKRAIKSDVAVYNLSNAKLHTHDCEWALKCTKNCIFLNKKELEDIFYIPCLVCGGKVFDHVDNVK